MGGCLYNRLLKGASMVTESDFMEICSRSGISIPDPLLGIGLELTYRDDPARTIVVYFLESDFPETWKMTMGAVLQLKPQWLLVSRYGPIDARQFEEEELSNLLDFLVEIQTKVSKESDDKYLISKDGKVLISYDHHMFEDGLAIYTNDVPFTSAVLCSLNELGAEIQLFSKRG